ncbi:cobalamin biosynthesis protein CobD [Sulfurimonas sp. SAG-AH-194-C20]|nr:adenosylcobinamide-phosphate synthase CbiB [Sulfurimonas sp. SAG-AH-194-C20]MDF1878625.1 cobalamin biosynthesis protein CobD [Sulfurimonas sp. SAG-AH-194-C20]
MTNIFITVFAYVIDRVFGELTFVKHPVIFIGELISYFERRFYKDSIFRGVLLLAFVLSTTLVFSFLSVYLLHLLPTFLDIIFTSLIASMFIAHNMLRDAVAGVTTADDKHHAISMLVSRDTKDLSESDIYKATIETYGENLSDGVIAPTLFLLLFGLPGIVFYKTVNTLDSMVGYRNEKYENYGKASAILDDILNYFPSRLTALLIMFLGKQKNLFAFYEDGKKHDSPNAGHPITAMALVLGVKLGGDTSYFGKLKKKASFGTGRTTLTTDDVQKALNLL